MNKLRCWEPAKKIRLTFEIEILKKLLSVNTIILLTTICCMGQNDCNQVRRISKSELKKLKSEGERFIPTSLKNYKVLVVKPSAESYENLQRKAHVSALVRNGYDTTLISSNVAFNNYALGNRNHYEKFGERFFQNVVSQFGKKGIEAEITTSGHENEYSDKDFRYLLKMDFVSTMRDPIKSWFSKPTYYFVDRVDNKYFEIFLPTNFFVWDLIGKK